MALISGYDLFKPTIKGTKKGRNGQRNQGGGPQNQGNQQQYQGNYQQYQGNQQQQQHPTQQYNPNIHKYCWTHGGCNHWGPECFRQANGHQQGASFQNKMGGSVKNCV